MFRVILLCLFGRMAYSEVSSSRHKSYHFTLTSGNFAPDNFPQKCYLINGLYPGPPVIVNQYDFVEIFVDNQLPVATSIHFHGILQTHTLNADGVPFVTQDLIQPNCSYVYRIQVEGQTGTYMYHGHHELDLVWLHGPFIILDNPAFLSALGADYYYDKGHEHVFQLESIFHNSLEDIVAGIRVNGTDDPDISSLSINGLSYGQWSTNGHAPGYEVVAVQPGKKYRLRIINTSMGSFFRFEIEGHSLQVIEVDGILIDPVVTNYLEINTGQRYSVLVTMNKTVSNYWISSTLLSGSEGPANGKSILHYAGASNPKPLRTQVFLQATPGVDPDPNWIYSEIHPNLNYIDNVVSRFPPTSNHSILIDMHFRVTEGPPRFLINGHAPTPPRGTYLTRVRAGEDITKADPHVFSIHEGDVVDIIFQNRVDDFLGCDEHPIHLHGHTFWVLASGKNTVDMETLPGELETASKKGNRLLYRDTFTLFPNQTPENLTSGAGCGWAVIRFKADNPGLWLVHCHVTSHMILGKMFTMYEYNRNNPELRNE